MIDYNTFHVVDHPLIKHKLSIMRAKETGSKDFRQMLSEIAMLMCYELTRDLPVEDVEIETPVAKMTAQRIDGKKLALISILFCLPVLADYFRTGLVERFPTLIVCGFTMIAAIQSLFAGMQLQTSVQKGRQDFEMQLHRVAEQKKAQLANEE